MNYVIADIHGCRKELECVLDKIRFSDRDNLYILGDSVDRGPEPIRLLTEFSMMPNVFHILGNHEYMAIDCLKKLDVEITEENCRTQLREETLTAYLYWLRDGGMVTAEQFRRLNPDQREGLLEYMEDMPLYEIVKAGGRTFLLVHAGISNFTKGKPMSAYREYELLFKRSDYQRRYFESTVVVTGHTPTLLLSEKRPPEVIFYKEANQIAMDCGCCFGGRLACLCLDTMEVFYGEKEG